MIVDFSYLWRLAHDKWGVYAKADRRVEPDLMVDDERRMANTKHVGLSVGAGACTSMLPLNGWSDEGTSPSGMTRSTAIAPEIGRAHV